MQEITSSDAIPVIPAHTESHISNLPLLDSYKLNFIDPKKWGTFETYRNFLALEENMQAFLSEWNSNTNFPTSHLISLLSNFNDDLLQAHYIKPEGSSPLIECFIQHLKQVALEKESPSNNPKELLQFEAGDILIEALRLREKKLAQVLIRMNPHLISHYFILKKRKKSCEMTALCMALQVNDFENAELILSLKNTYFKDKTFRIGFCSDWASICLNEMHLQISRNNVLGFNFLSSRYKITNNPMANHYLHFLTYLDDPILSCEMLEALLKKLSNDDDNLLKKEINNFVEIKKSNYIYFYTRVAEFSFAKMKILARYGAETTSSKPWTFIDGILDRSGVNESKEKLTALCHLVLHGCPCNSNSERKLKTLFSAIQTEEALNPITILLKCIQKIIQQCTDKEELLGDDDLVQLKNQLQNKNTLLYGILSLDSSNLEKANQFINEINVVRYNDKKTKHVHWDSPLFSVEHFSEEDAMETEKKIQAHQQQY